VKDAKNAKDAQRKTRAKLRKIFAIFVRLAVIKRFRNQN